MEIEYTGRQVTVTPALRTLAEDGVARIAKLFPRITSVHVILSAEKYRHTAEVTLKTRLHAIVGISESPSMETALREALDRAETQAVKCKKKLEATKRQPKEEKLTSEVQLQRPRRRAGQPESEAGGAGSVAAGANPSAAAAANGHRNNGHKANGRQRAAPVIPVTVHSFPSKTPISEPHIVRSTDSVALRPMTLEEAVKEAEFRDREVFLFRDNSGHVKVLHRKRDGKMELIEEP